MSSDHETDADRRVHPRFDLMAQVRVRRGKVDYLMDLSNISCGGALVDMGSLKAPSWIQRGRSVEIGIINPVALDTVELEAEIVRIEQSDTATRFAVRFVDLDAPTSAQIERLVAIASPEPARPPPLPATAAPPRVGPPPLPPGSLDDPPAPAPRKPPPLPRG
jgi:hypothetical protein